MKNLKILYSVSAAICLLIAGCVADEPALSLKPGDPLPRFNVAMIDGGKFSTSDVGEKILVIVFFNTTCPDCRNELPKLQAIYEDALASAELSSKLEFICIAREESAEDIEAYWKEHGLTMPVAAQPDRRIYNLFANQGIPRVYVAQNNKIISTSLEAIIF